MSSDSPEGIPDATTAQPVPEAAMDEPLVPNSAADSGPEVPGEAPSAQPDGESLTVAPEASLPQEDPDTHRFECRSCGFVYDPDEGVRKLGIVSGTPFRALDPGRFRCPVCRSPVGAFKDIGPRNKPSGFEENLNFGLGVNRLTPGQKNVLIFGGFALAIAFFLSLYSLR